MSAPTHPGFAEVAHDLVMYHPGDGETGLKLDAVRQAFHMLVEELTGLVPEGPDATLAARSIHRACQDTVFAIVHNQES